MVRMVGVGLWESDCGTVVWRPLLTCPAPHLRLARRVIGTCALVSGVSDSNTDHDIAHQTHEALYHAYASSGLEAGSVCTKRIKH